MTGTGTQNDPYIVDNTADFLEAIAQSGVYVQLGSDIDVAADGYEYIGTVTVKALSINGDGFAIRNATFQPGSSDLCFSIDTANGVWRDISFLDCSVKPHAENVTFFYGNNSSYSGMKLSLQVQPLSGFYLFSDEAEASNCAADITMNGGAILISFRRGSLSNSTFFIRGSYGFNKLIQGYNGNAPKQVQNVGIVFDGSLQNGSKYLGDNVNFVGCYFAFADSATIAEGGSISVSLGQYSTSGQNLVFSVGDGLSIYTPPNFPRLTTAQMKNKAYLQSIGWLP